METCRPTLTVGILTLNEEHHIARCLASVAFADQRLVIDSGSNDRTIEIARDMGAETYSYTDWQGFGVQRTRLLKHAHGDYIFFIDADEEVTPALREEIQTLVTSGTRMVACVRWQVIAYGKELRWFIGQAAIERLFPRAQLLGYSGIVHERAELSDPKLPRQTLKGKLLHTSRTTVSDSLAKLRQYAMLGAAKRAQKNKRGGVLRGLASGIAIFLRLYVFRLGFLGGGAGFLFCFFIALECFFRYAILYYDKKELRIDVKR